MIETSTFLDSMIESLKQDVHALDVSINDSLEYISDHEKDIAGFKTKIEELNVKIAGLEETKQMIAGLQEKIK